MSRYLLTQAFHSILFITFTLLLQVQWENDFSFFIIILIAFFTPFLPILVIELRNSRRAGYEIREQRKVEHRLKEREKTQRKEMEELAKLERVKKEQEKIEAQQMRERKERECQERPWLCDGTPDGGQPGKPLHIRRWIESKRSETEILVQNKQYIQALTILEYIIDRMNSALEELKQLGPESSTDLLNTIKEDYNLCSVKHASNEVRISLEKITIKPDEHQIKSGKASEELRNRVSNALAAIENLEKLAKHHSFINYLSQVVAYREQLKEDIGKMEQAIEEQQNVRRDFEDIKKKVQTAVANSKNIITKLTDRIRNLSEVLEHLKSIEATAKLFPSNLEIYQNLFSSVDDRLKELREIEKEFGNPKGIFPNPLYVDEAEISIKGILIDAKSIISNIDKTQNITQPQLKKVAEIKEDLIRANIIAENYGLRSYKSKIMSVLRRINELLSE